MAREHASRNDRTVTEQAALLKMQQIVKSFGPVPVLLDVTFELGTGEVHVLAGENGAGKSTLIKILSGSYQDYSGEIRLNGEAVCFRSPQEATSRGITVIHQEMSLINSLSVVENIVLGHPGAGPWINRRAEIERARRSLLELGLDLDLRRKVEEYPLATRQMIEIAKALSSDARIVIMDEPTSALNVPEIEKLFAVIKGLKQRGCGIVYISHRMEEIYRIGDRITVLRDGRNAGTESLSELSPHRLIQWMVGREISEQFPPRAPRLGQKRLEVRNFFVPDPAGIRPFALSDVSFEVRSGEILGIAGLEGSGKTELLKALFGAYGPVTRGSVLLDEKPLEVRTPAVAISQGLALLTNDRKETGLIPSFDLARNITAASIKAFSSGGWVHQKEEEEASRSFVRRLGIRCSSVRQEVMTLSGGNQQKVMLARWLQTRPKMLLLDEPTRGVDVGAKHDIYELVNECTDAGMGVLLITSELPELLALSDRIMVLHRGRIMVLVPAHEASAENVLSAAMGGGEGIQDGQD
jgi:ribose transport system ATP-binding protein